MLLILNIKGELESFQESIYNLHISKSKSEYLERLNDFSDRWDRKVTRKAFDYFIKQWVENKRFNKWQIFRSPPGYANTNSNIESFNTQIKGFTNKKKLTVFGMVDKCSEMIHYYSTVQAEVFNEFPKFNKKLNESALKFDKSLFKKSSYNKYNYKKYTLIDRVHKSCSCRGFLKQAICLHSLAFSHLKNLEWFGQKYTQLSNEFAYRNNRGRILGIKYQLHH